MRGKDNSLEGLCLSLLELAQIDIAMMEADEEDKNSISLIGIKED